MAMGFRLGKGGGGQHHGGGGHHHHGGRGRGGFGPGWYGYGPGYWEAEPTYVVVPPTCGPGTYLTSEGVCKPLPPGLRGLALRGLGEIGNAATANPAVTIAWGTVAAVSAGASAYHGYKRNNSVGWAIVWGLMGGLFPVISVAVAVAQGFGKRARS